LVVTEAWGQEREAKDPPRIVGHRIGENGEGVLGQAENERRTGRFPSKNNRASRECVYNAGHSMIWQGREKGWKGSIFGMSLSLLRK